MKMLVILSVLLLSGCSVHLEVGAGKNDRFNWTGKSFTDDDWIDHGGVGAYIGVEGRRRFSDRVDGMCYVKHYSQWNVGWPVDDRREDNLDTYGCGVSVRIFGERQ